MTDMMTEITGDGANVEVVDDEQAGAQVDVFELKESADEAPVVRAGEHGPGGRHPARAPPTSHWEPYEKGASASGSASTACCTRCSTPPKRLEPAIISRLKIMAEPGHRRAPAAPGRPHQAALRRGARSTSASPILPTIFGEKAVLRILDKESLQLDLTKLGFDPWSYEKFSHAIHQPYGMVLITGPTGSGKTTTLYSAISTHQLARASTS